MTTAEQHRDPPSLWRDRPAFVQLLGLSPLLAMADSVTSAIAIGLATVMVMTISSLVASAVHARFTAVLRYFTLMLLLAMLASCAELLFQLYAWPLHQSLVMLAPLIVGNCMLLYLRKDDTSTPPPLRAMLEGFVIGNRFLVVIVLFGALREMITLPPAGVFLLLSLLIALMNVITGKPHQPDNADEAIVPGARRVRVTGKV